MKGECEIINHYAELLQRERERAGFPSDTYELVLERIGKKGCGYYIVGGQKRCIFWLESVESEIITKGLARAQSFAHISRRHFQFISGCSDYSTGYAMEAEYW